MPFDCELIRDGLIAQPVNTLSSLALVLAGFLALRRTRLGAAALGFVGFGSVLFHARPSPGSTFVHDASIVLLIAVVATAIWRRRQQLPWPGLVTLSIGAGIWALSRTGGPICDPDAALQGHAVWHVLAAAGCWLVLTRSAISSDR